MMYSNGMDSYGLADFNNAIAAATSAQVSADQQVIALAKQINSQNIQFLTQQSQQAQQTIAPFVNMGIQGGQALGALLGINIGGANQNAQSTGVLTNGLDNFGQSNPYNPGTGTSAAAAKNYLPAGFSNNADYVGGLQKQLASAQGAGASAQNIASLQQQISQAQANPLTAAPANNMNVTQAMANGNNGYNPAGQTQALNTMLHSPMIQSQLQYGMEGVNSQLAAQGLTGSGAALKQLDQYGQGVAAPQINSYEQGLISMMGAGAQAAGQSANMSNQLGRDVANQNTSSGNTQSNALLNIGQVQAQGIMSQAQMSLMAAMGGMGGMGGNSGPGVGQAAGVIGGGAAGWTGLMGLMGAAI